MDDLDRIFHRLVSNIRHRHSEYLTMPFTVQELYETLIPYRHHRRELGIETNQDYEIAVTRLLSGERDYLMTDAAMRDKLKQEVESPNMDPGAFREFAASKVSLAPEALRRIRALTASGSDAGSTVSGTNASATPIPPARESSGAAAASSSNSAGSNSAAAPTPPFTATFPVSSPPAAPAPTPAPAASSGPPEASKAAPVALSSMMNAAPVAEGCRFCGGTLPEGRTVIYCPHCGNNLSVSRCPACGSELEKGWKFCATCGRGVG
jgi:hypothetical protein